MTTRSRLFPAPLATSTLLSLALGSALASCKRADTASPEPGNATPAAADPGASETEPTTEAHATDPDPEPTPDPVALAEAQARQGDRLYDELCASCHGEDGAGRKGKAPAVFGDGALPLRRKGAKARRGEFATAADVVAYVRQYMPPGEPGSLSDEEAHAVVALFLQGAGVDLERPLDGTTAGEIEPRLAEDDE